MLIRLLQGRVLDGLEAAFLERCREVFVATGPGTSGLASFVAGYRRVDGSERFLVVSGWDSYGDLRAGAEPDGVGVHRVTAWYAGVAEVDQADHFEATEAIPRGFVDAPGAVLRITRGFAIPGREESSLAYVRDAGRRLEPLALSVLTGRRLVARRTEFVMASIWPDRLALEALTGPMPDERPTDQDRPDLFEVVERSHWQVVELRLPEDLSAVAARRMLVARLAPEAAEAVVADLETRLGAGATRIAELGTTEYRRAAGRDLRVVTVRYPRERQAEVERAVSDRGGEILTARRPAVD